MTGFETIGQAGLFVFLMIVAIRLFIRVDWRGKLQIVAALIAVNTIATSGWSGALVIAAVIAALYAAKELFTRLQTREEAKTRRAGAILAEEFFRKEEASRMRQKMRDVRVPKRIGEDDSPAIKEARATLIRRVK